MPSGVPLSVPLPFGGEPPRTPGAMSKVQPAERDSILAFDLGDLGLGVGGSREPLWSWAGGCVEPSMAVQSRGWGPQAACGSTQDAHVGCL